MSAKLENVEILKGKLDTCPVKLKYLLTFASIRWTWLTYPVSEVLT